MNIRFAHLIVILAVLGWYTSSRYAIAQEANVPIEQLDVYRAVELAHQLNPSLNAMRQQVRRKAGERLTGYGIHAPFVSYFREGINDSGFSEQRLTFSQSIDFPLTSYYRISSTRTEQEALQLQVEGETRQVTSAVKKAYTELLYAQELVHLRAWEADLSQELVDAAAIRVEVGESAELEVMRAELGRAEAESGLAEANLAFEQARYVLFNVVGLDPAVQTYTIVFPDTLVYFKTNITQDAVLDQLQNQPELQSRERTIDAARLGVKQVRSSLLPALQFDIYPQDFGGGYNRYGFQVVFKMPLGAFTNYRGQMRMAKADVQTQTWNHQAVYLALKRDVEQAWHSYNASKRIIDRYSQVIRGRAEELLTRAQEGYQLGELDLLTLLDTQRTYLESELQYYNALRDYYLQLIELERYLNQEIVFVR